MSDEKHPLLDPDTARAFLQHPVIAGQAKSNDEEVIWATSGTGDEFQCVHVDAWREAMARITELEKRVLELEADLEISERSGGFGV